MKNIFFLLCFALLLGCNSNNSKETKSTVEPAEQEVKSKNEKASSEKKIITNGKAVFSQRGQNKIDLPSIDVTYTGYNTEHFQFKSDEDDKTDTNGDGYVVFGKQEEKKFRLTILDLNNGKAYDSGNKITFSKEEEFFLGSGLLDETKKGGMLNISFWVVF